MCSVTALQAFPVILGYQALTVVTGQKEKKERLEQEVRREVVSRPFLTGNSAFGKVLMDVTMD